MPAVESLECFTSAARLLSFRAAARAVALSPAAFGQRIRALEEELEVRLFLTEAGLALLPYAERAVEAVAAVTHAARGDTRELPMELTLGTRHELGLSWVTPMLPRLTREHPGLLAHLYFGSGQDLILRVRSLAIDCAVTSTRLTDPKLDSIRLHEEKYVLVGRPQLLRRLPLREPSDARRHTLIDTTEELPLFRYWRDAPGGVDSIAFGTVRRMGTIAAIREFVVRGEGVAVLPEYYVRKDLARRRLQLVLEEVVPLSDHFRLVFRTDDPRRSYFTSLAETMRSVPLQ
jgi:DNA-binding transcriptional LysR family regulator